MWELHDEKVRHLAVGVWNRIFSYLQFLLLLKTLGPAIRTLEWSQFAVVQWVGQLMATLSGPQANVPPEFHLLGALDTPAGRPHTRLYEIVRAPRAVS